MKLKSSMLMILCVFALISGCAKKEMMVTQPTSSPTAEITAPVKPSAPQPPAEMATEPMVVGDLVQGKPTTLTGDATQKSPLETIYFDFDSWLLTPQAREILTRNAEWLRRNPGKTVILEGHTDERGSDAYNLALGEKRAMSARNYLVTLGIEASRLEVISFGEEKPAAEGHDESAWSRNRRVEFIPHR